MVLPFPVDIEAFPLDSLIGEAETLHQPDRAYVVRHDLGGDTVQTDLVKHDADPLPDRFRRIAINQPGGHTFVIESPGTAHVSQAMLNGQELQQPVISHQQIVAGGLLKMMSGAK